MYMSMYIYICIYPCHVGASITAALGKALRFRTALALSAELRAAGVGFVPAALAAQNGTVSACEKVV